MAIVCAALVIILSAFNGIESVIQRMYGKFDADITVTHNTRKTFLPSEFNESALFNEDIAMYSKGIEELVVLQNDKKWTNAKILGVEPEFLNMIEYSNNSLLDPPDCKRDNACLYPLLEEQYVFLAPGLLDKLEIRPGQTEFSLLAGKREMKINQGKEIFKKTRVQCASVFDFNKEVNEENVLWSLKQTQEFLGYKNEISHIYIKLKEGVSQEDFKKDFQREIGNNFIVKTNYEKHEIIYKTSKSERLIILIIMIFIFVFAAINLIASLTIQYLEKQKDIQTLRSVGFKNKDIQYVFILNGILICFAGLLLGLTLGYGVCLFQKLTGFVSMGGIKEGFPIVFRWADLFFIIMMVFSFGCGFSWCTIKLLSRRF
ncbi:MAG: FtsX-like permease family protein [Bacteroidetes bacterium]|nr:FtsX-like permease family protein [Bacteroidota bacterium]